MARQARRWFSAGDSLVAALSRLQSIDVCRPDRICKLRKPLSVVIVGGTCAGKSMLARAAEVHPALVGNTELVPRCSTREPRQGDVADGLTSITWNEFHAHRAAGTFAMSWERPLKNGSSIGYGCLMPSGNGAPVFVAGHGIYNNKETLQPPTALERALIVGIVAPAEVRAERLRLRSPDVIARGMATTEALLAHDDDAMAANVDMLVRNYGANEAIAIDDFVYALALVLDAAGYKLPSAT